MKNEWLNLGIEETRLDNINKTVRHKAKLQRKSALLQSKKPKHMETDAHVATKNWNSWESKSILKY